MALNIANRNVEKKAIEASRLLGVNKTAAVEIALDYYLAHHRIDPQQRIVRKEVARLFDEMADLPVVDHREADEIVGYDADGLP